MKNIIAFLLTVIFYPIAIATVIVMGILFIIVSIVISMTLLGMGIFQYIKDKWLGG